MDLFIALLLSFLAGLSTGVGAILAFFIKKPKKKYLALAMGFSAGVMIFVSFDELLPYSYENHAEHMPILGILLGMIVMAASILLI